MQRSICGTGRALSRPQQQQQQQRCSGTRSSGASAALLRSAAAAPAAKRRTAAVAVRASTEGVQDLLSRDRKRKDAVLEGSVATEFDEPAPAPAAAVAAEPAEAAAAEEEAPASKGGGRGGRGGRLKSRQQRRRDMAATEDSASGRGPRRCKDAIDAGLALFSGGDYAGAIESFSLALELPGNGAYRLPGSPREYLCPSDAEENAALYNMACCYAAMGQRDAALTCLEAVLENGFDDVATMTRDPDLASLRGAELDALIARHRGLGARVAGLFSRKERPVEADPNVSRPWWEVRW